MIEPFTRVDRWLFGPGDASRLALLRGGLAAVILLRITFWPFAQLAGGPAILFRPPPFLAFLHGAPSAGVIVALQVTGAIAAFFAIAGTERSAAAFRLAFVAFLALAGFKTSTGKILHNDVALILVSVPVALCSVNARLRDRRRGEAFGWPLRASLLALAIIYFACGARKLAHSGLDWVTGDNMRWILYGGIDSARAPTTAIARLIADRPWASHLSAASLVGLELAFPVVLISRRARPYVACAAVMLHTMTWLTLGLDYWSWSLVAAIVLTLAWLPQWGEATASGAPASAIGATCVTGGAR